MGGRETRRTAGGLQAHLHAWKHIDRPQILGNQNAPFGFLNCKGVPYKHSRSLFYCKKTKYNDRTHMDNHKYQRQDIAIKYSESREEAHI